MLQKIDLLFFLGKKETIGKEKILCLNVAKAYFGSAIQLCYQIWILQVTTYNGEFERVSQYLSIIMSFLLLTKTSIELISYSRPKNQKENSDEEFTVAKFLKIVSYYCSWFPLILTSLLFKIGTINLLVQFFEWYSLIIIFGIFCLNLSSSFTFSYLRSNNTKLSLVHKMKDIPQGAEKSQLDKFLMSYSNIFVISRPVNTIR